MNAQVTVTLPEKLYEQIQNLAHIKQQPVAETIVDHLTATLLVVENKPLSDEIRAQHSTALACEERAYIQLHPQLKRTHLGRYVAIYQGKLIDEADEFGVLVERVRSRLPNEVVWMTQVKEEPIQTLVKRGNRLSRNGE